MYLKNACPFSTSPGLLITVLAVLLLLSLLLLRVVMLLLAALQLLKSL
jgi:hypothetical protein